MAIFWKRGTDGKMTPAEEGLEDVEFKPEKLKTDIESSVKAQFEAFQTANTEAMKPMFEFISSVNSEREARRKAAETAAANANKEELDDNEEFLIDPDGAVKKRMQPIADATMRLAARMARQEHFETDPYYHGEIKQKIDALIDSLPLSQRSNAGSLDNCKKIVMFDYQDKIAKGEIHKRNGAVSFESQGTGGPSSKSKESDDFLSPDEKQAAKIFGLTDKQYAESRKEMSFV